jgi:hypothetical protein
MSLRGEILALCSGYVLLGVLVLLVVARARLSFVVRAGLIVLTSAFYVLVFFRTEGLLGWSAPQPLPPRFQMLWARTIDPIPVLNEPGAIHLWVESLDEDNMPSGVPRAYQLPYSAGLARKVEAARSEIMNGRPQGGRAEQFGFAGGVPEAEAGPIAMRPGAEPGGDPSGGGLLDPAFLRGESQSVDFAPLPKPTLPPKDAP